MTIFLYCEFAQNELKVLYESFCDYLFDSCYAFKFLSASRNSGLSALKIPYAASSHPEKNSQTHKPDWNGCPSMPGRFRGVHRKMVMVNKVFRRFGICWTWMTWSGYRA
jgi:hypothetical protein